MPNSTNQRSTVNVQPRNQSLEVSKVKDDVPLRLHAQNCLLVLVRLFISDTSVHWISSSSRGTLRVPTREPTFHASPTVPLLDPSMHGAHWLTGEGEHTHSASPVPSVSASALNRGRSQPRQAHVGFPPTMNTTHLRIDARFDEPCPPFHTHGVGTCLRAAFYILCDEKAVIADCDSESDFSEARGDVLSSTILQNRGRSDPGNIGHRRERESQALAQSLCTAVLASFHNNNFLPSSDPTRINWTRKPDGHFFLVKNGNYIHIYNIVLPCSVTVIKTQPVQ